MDIGVKFYNDNPKLRANVLSKLIFIWIIPLYRKILRNGLEIGDVFKVLDCDKSEKLSDRLAKNWNDELAKAKSKNQKPKLLNAITKTYFWNYMIYGGMLFVLQVGLRCGQPVVLSHLISLFDGGKDNQIEMCITAGILIITSILVIFIIHHTNFGQASVGMRIRIAVSSLIYRKILRLHKRSLNQADVGQVINLLSNDVTRFDLVVLTLHHLWIMPFQFAVITYLLLLQVGISSLAGIISVVLLSLPVQGYLGKLASNFRSKVAQKTDYRITLMSEIISGIQVIKLYAWEKPFQTIVNSVRCQEVKALTISSYLRGIYLSFIILIERIALFLTLVCNVLLGNMVVAEQVFAMAQFFNFLQLTMSVFCPVSINLGAETLVAIDRIQNFLMVEEKEKSSVDVYFDKGIQLTNISMSWISDQKFIEDLTFNVPSGSLCAIVGPVGAGKSSVLHLLLNELTPASGTIKIQGTISYSSQEPWLFASTVRDNILFGEEYNQKRYKKVIKVCALQKDFDQLQFGDKTLVGERGAALSGGQRARVNLARAVYRDADIYLLDDPLSAVDTRVGKHLFEECILKFLKGKTRILVTHQTQYLKKVDNIILVNNGGIEVQGSYEELSQTNLNFCMGFVDEIEEIVTNQKTPSMHLSGSFMLESEPLSETSGVHDEEEKEIGTSNKTSSLMEYISASGNICSILFVVLTLIVCQVLTSGNDYWVSFWTEQEALKRQNAAANATNGKNLVLASVMDTYTAIYFYTGFIVALIIITIIRSYSFFKSAMKASASLHNKMFFTLLEAPMRFYKNNPCGRILNRFSKDLGAVDEILPKVLLEAIQITLVFCGILVMVITSNYYMVIIMIVMVLILTKVGLWFIKITKQIKHLEGIVKSPVFSHANASLNGITTIRAFRAENMLQNQFDTLQDIHTSTWFLNIICMVSFGFLLDFICVVFIGCTAFSFIILNQYGHVSGSFVGLALSQSLILTGMLQYGVRQFAEVVNQLTSVERILQYTEIETESPFSTAPENLPIPPWPKNGMIEIKDLSLKYSPSDPAVLKHLNINIKPGQKIGIVGRTGAGKSSLITALFRLTEIEGDIIIDGVNTKSLGLHDLRKSISIIPQEPVLFSATLRYNLDPYNEFSDEQLFKVLEEVELKEIVCNLDMMVAERGTNFSVGQRQLLCLGRAILRNNKILVLDEATANIDENTDSLIQKIIRKKFNSCTVLTVAHRLKTIMDSDRVMVMDDGEIVEFDYPYELLLRPNTIFYKMVSETGLAMSIHLEEIALDTFLHR